MVTRTTRDHDVGEDDVGDQRRQQSPVEVAVVGRYWFGRGVHRALLSPPRRRCKVADLRARACAGASGAASCPGELSDFCPSDAHARHRRRSRPRSHLQLVDRRAAQRFDLAQVARTGSGRTWPTHISRSESASRSRQMWSIIGWSAVAQESARATRGIVEQRLRHVEQELHARRAARDRLRHRRSSSTRRRRRCAASRWRRWRGRRARAARPEPCLRRRAR